MTTNTYVAGTGWLYRFDPRAKLLLMLLMCIWFFLPVPLLHLAIVVALVVVSGASNTGWAHIWKTFCSISPMLVFMVFFMPFNVREGSPLVTLGNFTLITAEGLEQALRLMSRFIGITYACTLLFATTVMHEVMLALRWYRLPYKASLVVTLAFTYIPFIAESFNQISESHRLREAEDEQKKRWTQRLKDLVPTLTSALVVALRSIPNLAMSLEMRGFGRTERRSSYHTLASYRHVFTHFLLSCMIPVVLYLVSSRF
ncbi:MAG: energy-coupling factor transporter transmembrane protein EcfT [Sphaerochaeta sp.]